MKADKLDNLFSDWARVGVLFGTRPSGTTPDLERLLLATVCHAHAEPRLFSLAVTWLSEFDNYVARHRLKCLADELDADAKPVLGLLLDLAVKHGASREFLVIAKKCGKRQVAGPLFDVHLGSKARRRIAENNACPEALERNLWAPDVEPKLDALRPSAWVLRKNPDYNDRIVRKGDLRATVLEVLRRDLPGHVAQSEVDLAEACSANRPAIRASLDDLEREGFVLRHPHPTDGRRTLICLDPQHLPDRNAVAVTDDDPVQLAEVALSV